MKLDSQRTNEELNVEKTISQTKEDMHVYHMALLKNAIKMFLKEVKENKTMEQEDKGVCRVENTAGNSNSLA